MLSVVDRNVVMRGMTIPYAVLGAHLSSDSDVKDERDPLVTSKARHSHSGPVYTRPVERQGK
jgi:hypothetical protein